MTAVISSSVHHIKPTPSISQPQSTVTSSGENLELEIKGRHDPVIVPRAVVVVEAMAALTITDALFDNMSARMDRIHEFYQQIIPPLLTCQINRFIRNAKCCSSKKQTQGIFLLIPESVFVCLIQDLRLDQSCYLDPTARMYPVPARYGCCSVSRSFSVFHSS